MLRTIGCIAAVVFSGAFAYGQLELSAAGGKGAGSSAKVSYTDGQTTTISMIGNSGSLIEGTHQPFEIQVVTKLDPATQITLECEANPNPATDFVILKIHRDQIENMKYQLYDLNGKVLEEAFIGDAETTISLKHYKPTKYFLKVLDNTKEVMSFGITKNDQL